MTEILLNEKNRLLEKLSIFIEEKNKVTEHNKQVQLKIIENKINEINDKLEILEPLINGEKTIKDLVIIFHNDIEKIKRRYFYLQSLGSII
jgi:hypothetical protein